MKLNKLMAGLLAGLLVASIMINTTAAVNVHADAKNTNSVNNNLNPVSKTDIDTADQYVTVKNNQYLFNAPANSGLSAQQIDEIKTMISQANNTVASSGISIDPATKAFLDQPAKMLLGAAYNKHYTYKNFWWGTRYYFTSNYAVAELTHEFHNVAHALEVSAVIAGPLTCGVAAGLYGLGSVYYSTMADDLNDYNAIHPKNQIYMDLNKSTHIYSMHVLA